MQVGCWTISSLLWAFGPKGRGRKIMLIWLATAWASWSVWNDIIFNSMEFQVVEVTHRMKLLSWL